MSSRMSSSWKSRTNSNGNGSSSTSVVTPNRHKSRRGGRGGKSDLAEKVVVAIDATKEITKDALEWALSNVMVQAGESVTLLAILPSGSCVRKLWGFPALLPLLRGDCTYRLGRSGSWGSRPTKPEVEEEVRESCTSMLRQLQNLCNARKITIRVKVIEAKGREATAVEAKKLGATWVILDRHLKKEGKYCMELLHCNIVLVKPLEPKVLRLNLKRKGPLGLLPESESSSRLLEGLSHLEPPKGSNRGASSTVSRFSSGSNQTTPSSSPDDIKTPFTPSEPGTSSNSSSEPGNSPYSPSGPQLDHGSSGMIVRGAILEATAEELMEEGGSYTNYDSDSDDGSLVPGVRPDPRRHASNCNTKIDKSFNARAESQLENQHEPSGNRSMGFSGELTPAFKVVSRTASRTASRASSRRESPVKSSQRESPVKSVNASRRQSFESRPSISRRESSLGPKLEAMLQVNSEIGRVPLQRGSLSELFKPEREVRQVKEVNKVTGDSRYKYSGGDQGNRESGGESLPPRPKQGDLDRTSSVRKAMMLSQHTPLGAPPLCSICQHKAPVFGKPPRRYSYAELELATGGFSQANFLAEGGYGSVHRGVLPDGQAVAVKQHKLASTQETKSFVQRLRS